MNVQVATLPQSQVSLDIEVDSAAIGSAIDRAYQRLSQRVNVPGFRRGKAPRPVLEAAIGRAAVLEEAVDIAVNDAYKWALDQTELEPITSPEIDLQGSGLDPSQPLFFTAKFYVQPSVQLGEYRSIRVTPPKGSVDDDAVEAVITRMAEGESPWESVEGRPAEAGDMAVIKIKGTVEDETVIDQDEDEYYLNAEGTGDPNIPDLTPHLVGMNIGETRDFAIELPEGYKPEEYAGKTLQCHVELLRLEHKAAPVVDDAFAQSVGQFATLDALRGRVRESLEAQQQMTDTETFVAEVTRHAVDAATVEIPPPMVDDEVHRMLDDLRQEVESRQHLTFDLYLRLVDKTEQQLHDEFHEPAEARVKNNLVLEAIADAEGITAPREQVEAEVREVAALPTVRERDRRRILTSPLVRARIEARLKRRLALQRLLQIANPTDDSVADDSADTTTSDSAPEPRELEESVSGVQAVPDIADVEGVHDDVQSPSEALGGTLSHAGGEES